MRSHRPVGGELATDRCLLPCSLLLPGRSRAAPFPVLSRNLATAVLLSGGTQAFHVQRRAWLRKRQKTVDEKVHDMLEARMRNEALFVGDENMTKALARENETLEALRVELLRARQAQRAGRFVEAQGICKAALRQLTAARTAEPSAKVRGVYEAQMRSKVMPLLNECKQHQHATVLQGVGRGHLARKALWHKVERVTALQAKWRGDAIRKRPKLGTPAKAVQANRRENARKFGAQVRIAAHVRRKVQQRRFNRELESIRIIVRVARHFLASLDAKRERAARDRVGGEQSRLVG